MTLDYKVLYSNRKTISITVERDRRVVVRAPNWAPEEAVSAVVERKRYWIWQKKRDPRKYMEHFYVFRQKRVWHIRERH